VDSGTNQAPHSHYLDAVQIGRAFAAMAVALLHVVKDTDRLYLRYADLDPGLKPSFIFVSEWIGVAG